MIKTSTIISAIPFVLFCHFIEAKQECDSNVANKTPASQFIADKVNGTVLDQATKLEWKACVEGMTYVNGNCAGSPVLFKWDEALAMYDGKNNGWRVPNDNEFESIIEKKCKYPAFNIQIFPMNSDGEPYAKKNIYWTSEQSPTRERAAVTYSMGKGDRAEWFPKTTNLLIRLVRDGQWNTETNKQDVNSAIAIPSYLWDQLTPIKKAQISAKYKINLLSDNMLAQITDAQTLDKSIAASNAGSNLGAVVGQAAYIDNAFKGDSINYSATGQVGAAIAGAIIGASLDTSGAQIFKTRYTVKTRANEIQYIEDVSNTPLRHSVGLCVFTLPFGLDKDNLCNLNQSEFFAYLDKKLMLENKQSSSANSSSETVLCKVGSNASTMMAKSTCTSLGGLAN